MLGQRVSRMERPENGLNVELAGLEVGLAATKRLLGGFQPAAYATEDIAREASHAAGCCENTSGEFCVHGIVVHLRLGNCIGYSLRERCLPPNHENLSTE